MAEHTWQPAKNNHVRQARARKTNRPKSGHKGPQHQQAHTRTHPHRPHTPHTNPSPTQKWLHGRMAGGGGRIRAGSGIRTPQHAHDGRHLMLRAFTIRCCCCCYRCCCCCCCCYAATACWRTPYLCEDGTRGAAAPSARANGHASFSCVLIHAQCVHRD